MSDPQISSRMEKHIDNWNSAHHFNNGRENNLDNLIDDACENLKDVVYIIRKRKIDIMANSIPDGIDRSLL